LCVTEFAEYQIPVAVLIISTLGIAVKSVPVIVISVASFVIVDGETLETVGLVSVAKDNLAAAISPLIILLASIPGISAASK